MTENQSEAVQPSATIVDDPAAELATESATDSAVDSVESTIGSGSTAESAPSSTAVSTAGDEQAERVSTSGSTAESADIATDGAEGDKSDLSDSSDETESAEDRLVHEGDIAADYLERLLDIIDFDGDIDLDVENGRALVAIVGDKGLDPLIGHQGATVDALQELTRLAVLQQTGTRSRLMLDIGGFRAQRRAELAALARRTAESVLADGGPKRLSPMNAFERKVVHDEISSIDGVHSESEGEDPNRRVVVSTEQ
jgi:spoIIIJ-associated protein